MTVSTLGQRIAERRGKRTQTWLAGRVGVTRPAVSNWEADRHPPEIAMVAKLAAALGCDAGWLAFGEPREDALGPWFVDADGVDGDALYGPFGGEADARTFAAGLMVAWPPRQSGPHLVRWTAVTVRQAVSPESQR